MKTNVYIDTPDRQDAGYAIALPNGLVFSRSLSRHEYLRSQVMSIVSSTNSTPVEAFNYTYDALCRPVSRNADTFGYNARSEVTSETHPGRIGSYSYDEIGNLTWYSANNLNQYTEFDYDLDGNMTTNYNTVMSYDAQSRLSSVSALVYTNDEWRAKLLVSNRYDHIGRRVKKITPDKEITFFYDGWNLIEERVAYTNGNSTTFRYYWGKDLSGTLQGACGVGGLLYLTITTSTSQLTTYNSQLFIPCYDNNGNTFFVGIHNYSWFDNKPKVGSVSFGGKELIAKTAFSQIRAAASGSLVPVQIASCYSTWDGKGPYENKREFIRLSRKQTVCNYKKNTKTGDISFPAENASCILSSYPITATKLIGGK